jgi:protein phosphatase
VIYSCASHRGKVRKNNEDYCKGEVIDTEFGSIGIFALADGMGGHNKGEVASKMAVENIVEFFKNNLLQSNNIKIDYIDDIIKQAYHNVNYKIYQKSISDKEFEGMGTTLVIAIVYKHNIYVANVGDSRCYLLNKYGFKKITIDHSVVEELVKAEVITEEEAKTHPRRNQITRAIGTEEMVIVDIFKQNIEPEYTILLTSDGLTGFVDDEDIKNILLQNKDINYLTEDLINKANDISGKDNISVVLIRDK